MKLLFVPGLVLALLAPPFLASGSMAAEPEVESSEADRLIDDVIALIDSKPESAIRLIDRSIDRQDKHDRQFLLSLRGLTLVKLGKIDASRKDFRAARALDPVNEAPSRFKFLAGVYYDKTDMASEGLDELIAVAPDAVRSLSETAVYGYLTKAKGEHADDQRISLAELGYGGLDGYYIATNAVRIQLKRKQVDKAIELSDRIVNAQSVQEMLIDRVFEPIWPALEARAGDQMAAVGEKAIIQAEFEFREAPDSISNKKKLLSALAAMRRFEEADAVGKLVDPDGKQLASADEDYGWAINEHAFALHSWGRKEEADRRFAALVDARADEGWVVSMAINRVELLVRDRNYAAADRLMAVTEGHATTKGSDYARQLVRRLKLCTLIGLGRKAEAGAVSVELARHADDAPTASVEGYLCAGKTAEARAMVLKLLGDPDRAPAALSSLQRGRMLSSDPSVWDSHWVALRQDAAVEAAFQKAGRDLPDRFRVG